MATVHAASKQVSLLFASGSPVRQAVQFLQAAAFRTGGRLTGHPRPILCQTRTRATCMPLFAIAAPAMEGAQEVTPARLPGTKTDFPIPEDKLIKLAQELFEKDAGVSDDSLLSEDFRFEFPVISLDRESYLKAVRGFDIKGALPDLDPHPYHWRVDPYEPNRVWFTTRVTGTHKGTLKFGGTEYKATGRVVQGAPECQSFVFREDGKCTSYTGGYIMDRRVGNTKKMGALFGILAAIGAPVPQPGSLSFTLLSSVNWLRQKVTGILASLTGSAAKKD